MRDYDIDENLYFRHAGRLVWAPELVEYAKICRRKNSAAIHIGIQPAPDAFRDQNAIMRVLMYVTEAMHMTDAMLRSRFEEALGGEAYAAAWRYALRLAGRREDAEDLLQDSLLHAYVKFRQLRNPDAFRGWLMSIVRTRFLARRRKFSPVTLETPPEGPADAGRTPTPDEEAAADALRRLPETQGEILSLFYIDGLSLRETGAVLGISERTAKQRIFRARKAFGKVYAAGFARDCAPAVLGGD